MKRALCGMPLAAVLLAAGCSPSKTDLAVVNGIKKIGDTVGFGQGISQAGGAHYKGKAMFLDRLDKELHAGHLDGAQDLRQFAAFGGREPPAAPVAKAATGVTTNAFTANWNSSSGATGYLLDISTDSAFNNYVAGFQNTGVGTLLSVYIGGLSAGTTYYYRVRANNSNGTSSNSATISATTLLKLGYARQGSVLVFSWPTNAAGFALQYGPSLPPANWTAALPAPVVAGGQYVVTNSLVDAGRSYRLSKP